jgi:thiol-disulfide isomerase/thioredoxin
MRYPSFILPIAFAAMVSAAEPAGPEPVAASPREAALERLLSERVSPEAFAQAVEEATRQGIGEQALLEAKFIFHVDRQEDAAIAAMLPEFLKRNESFKLAESEIFATKEDWLAVIEYVQAISALRNGDKAAFKKHITEAFWLSPKQGSAFAPHIERLRLDETMASLKVDFTLAFAPVSGGEPIALSKILGTGKAMLLQFWSPLSGECEASLPDFVAIEKELAKNNVPTATLILESSGKSISDTLSILKPLGANPPGTWLVDHEQDPISALMRVQNVPVFALISPEGKVLFNGTYDAGELWNALATINPSIKRPAFTNLSE